MKILGVAVVLAVFGILGCAEKSTVAFGDSVWHI